MSLFLGIFFGVMFSLMILSVEKFYKYFGSKNDPGGSNSKQESTSEKDANKGQGMMYKNRVNKKTEIF